MTPPRSTPDTDPDEAVLELAPDLDAPALARDFVTEHRDHLAAELVEDARLLVSEIVTNAVRHGRGAVVLRLRVSPPGIGIAVRDSGDAVSPTAPERPDDAATSGRGLLIVDALASAWGVVPSEPPPGKTVWFELARNDVPGEPSPGTGNRTDDASQAGADT